ncbi:MAG: succinate dehydrogenase/fumarate reductase iron-sulfur subunit [Candidatus Hydrogenedentes bacterium]|nr:succinate dehydrogenase/fumarate reductase iron-sulfur subunit [Candidatus Hydrogenedentota bacterium]
MSSKINLTLRVWRQKNAHTPGRLETYEAKDIDSDASFLEMLDIVNAQLELKGIEPIAFDHDCREGICGCCGAVVNGHAHGPEKETTLCQLHMRKFKDGETIVIEPWRAKAFPVIKDLVVDRTAFDRIIAAGGFISVRTGQAPEAHATPVPKDKADWAMDAAQCIGCGACVAACPNASAMLFVSAKVTHLNVLPQGQPEKHRRVLNMVQQMDAEGFGNCSNHYECEAQCPKGISVKNIAKMNRDHLTASMIGA